MDSSPISFLTGNYPKYQLSAFSLDLIVRVEKSIKTIIILCVERSSKQKTKLISIGVFVVILAVAAIILINEQYWYFWTMLAAVGSIILAKVIKKLIHTNTHPDSLFKQVLDSIAIAI